MSGNAQSSGLGTTLLAKSYKSQDNVILGWDTEHVEIEGPYYKRGP